MARTWRSAHEKPSFFKDKLLPYGVPIACLLLVAGLAWYIRVAQETSCDKKFYKLASETKISGKFVAVAIGITDYDKPSMKLEGSKADATEVMRVLVERYGFEPVRPDGAGSVLIVSGGAIEPTFKNIKDHMFHAFQSLGETDSLLIYFAGHGTGDRDDVFGLWLPKDADEHATVIDHEWRHGLLKNSMIGHVLFIADSCYSGKGLDKSYAITRKIVRNKEESTVC